MLDFGALPPEVNSGRMYSGSGAGSMMAAAAAWDGLAGQLDSVSRTYSSVISGLQGENWSGGASEAMVAAAAPYVAWATSTGAQAEEAARRARAAAAAYEAAFAATVPPKLVTANRTQLANLVATDFLGQNTSAIAATEAAYAEMWAQDAAAMYGYAASSAAATRLTPFSQPSQTTNPAGQSGQGAAVAQAVGTSAAGHSQTTLSQLMSAVPQQLQALAAGGTTSSAATSSASSSSVSTSLLTAFSDFNTLTSPVNLGAGLSRTYTSAGSMGYAAKRDFETHTAAPEPKPAPPPQPAPPPVSGMPKMFESGPAGIRPPVAANVGGAAPVGGLSVPPSWRPPTPAPLLGNEPLWGPETNSAAAPSTEASPGVVGAAPTAGMGPMAGMPARASVSSVLRVGPRRFKMPRPPTGG
ncbi:PPE family protein [Mycobacterium sp. pUA109]|uniref:PPE family protein n=1 Tax=Mycobacterium sp. pUA109 TaxID=3238982 RepID=UPI00351B7847